MKNEQIKEFQVIHLFLLFYQFLIIQILIKIFLLNNFQSFYQELRKTISLLQNYYF